MIGESLREDELVDPWIMVLDESIRQDVITVAGVMLPVSGAEVVVEAWHAMKLAMGLERAAELKYTMNASHPTRQALDARGAWRQAERVPHMLRAIGHLDVLIISNTLVDERTIREGKAVDFYLNAFDWCLRRFANHIQLSLRYHSKGPHMVVVDMPPDPGEIEPSLRPRLLDLVEHMGTATFEHYQERFLHEERFRSGGSAPSLRMLGFAPMLAATHARHSDLHQIADVVAGAISDFCHWNLSRADFLGNLPVTTHRDENLRLIAGKIRCGKNFELSNYGFGLWPQTAPRSAALLDRVGVMRRAAADA